MKRLLKKYASLLSLLLFFFGLVTHAETLHDVRTLSGDKLAQHPVVRFEATVVYFDNAIHALYLQDGDEGIFVRTTRNEPLVPGDRVRAEGHLIPELPRFLIASRIDRIGRVPLPPARTATFDDLVRREFMGTRVKIHGRIRSANLVSTDLSPAGSLQILLDGGNATLEVESRNLVAMRALLDDEVEVVGVASFKYDGKLQQTGIRIRLNTLADLRILQRAPHDPWQLPVTHLGSIFTGYRVYDHSNRLRVQGTITYYEPGVAAILQNGAESLWIETDSTDPLRIGDRAEAIGFPAVDEDRLKLTLAQFRDSGIAEPVTPFPARWNQLAAWKRNAAIGHNFDLVSISGRLVSHVRAEHQDEYVLTADGRLFTAMLRTDERSPSRPMPDPPTGSLLNMTGICWFIDSTPVNGEVRFLIRLRSPSDIVFLSGPPLWSMRNLAAAIILLGAILLALSTHAIYAERRARHLSAARVELERRRRHILEDINAMKPLADIIESIVDVVSLRLHGAPCWCSIAGGATLGKRPSSSSHMRIVEQTIPARQGAALGSIFIALPAKSRPRPIEEESLAMGIGLVGIAIESRRLYSDLLHRSAFDQLTELLNRSAFHSHLDRMILSARENGSIFALIYIDLDNFKLVNDTYGHNVGDLVLQQAAHRMKALIRPADRLARLGGDEFAILVASIRDHHEAEEIVRRLNLSLAEPYRIEGLDLPGSASAGIALYPADAQTRDELLKSADAAMYAVKTTHASARRRAHA